MNFLSNMTPLELQDLEKIAHRKGWEAARLLKEYLKGVEVQKSAPEANSAPNTRTWTDNQRKAFHVGCQELADYLNEHGKDMRAVLKADVDIPWTKDTVKEYIFRPIMKAMFGYESHTELKKIEEVSKLWDVAMRHLGEKVEVEYMEFPHDKKKADENMGGYKTKAGQSVVDYPEHTNTSFDEA